MADRTTVYTDGACSGNPGPGGWAWVVPEGPFASGADPATTNQRMELTAALSAVRANPGALEVLSDSTYVVNCFRDRWWEAWIRRGWVNSKRQAVANRDLWEPLVNEVLARDVELRWVKGHSDDRWNDLADRLAVEATVTQRGRSGDTPPAEVGPADLPRARAGSGPTGHRVVVTGHRPPDLGGYGETETVRRIRGQLIDILSAMRQMHPDLTVLTGLGLGVETLAAEAARDAGVPYAAVLAFPDLDSRWPDESRRRFAQLLSGARESVTLQKRLPESTPKMSGAFGRRDAWLRDHADEAVVVWDGGDGHLGSQVRSLQNKLGEENVWVIDPHLSSR